MRSLSGWTGSLLRIFFVCAIPCHSGMSAAVGPFLRPAFCFKDGAVLQANEPIAIWGTCDSHAAITVTLGDETLITENDSSGWWHAVFPARPAAPDSLTLTILSEKEKVVVNDLTVGDTGNARALRLAAPFQSHAVLQRGRPIPVWGTGPAGARIEAKLGDESLTATCDDTGRWNVVFGARQADGAPLTLTVETDGAKVVLADILIGDVWLAGGQSNMEWVYRRLNEAGTESAAAQFPTLRYFTGPDFESAYPQSQRAGEWLVCSPSTVGDFSGVGFYFARALQQRLNIPIGLVDVNWGGTRIEPWIPPGEYATQPELAELDRSIHAWHPDFPEGRAAQKSWLKEIRQWSGASLAALEAGRTPAPLPSEPGVDSVIERKQNPARIFNAMVAPLGAFPVRGVIWYQGETNAGDALYLPKLRALISGWRKIWGSDLPFYYVQLAAFNNGRPPEKPPFTDHPWTVVRDAQRQALTIPHTGMAVAIDVGEDKVDPHPKNKRDVGDRLARWALHDEYGLDDVVPSGPVFERAEVADGKVRVHFRHADGGLMAGKKEGTEPVKEESGKIRWVSLKGSDGQWVEADVEIDGDTLVVSQSSVPAPSEIAYAWAGFPLGANLYGRAGLPASPFRVVLSSAEVPARK